MKTEIVKLTEKRHIAVYSTDDVEPVLEHNKMLRSMEQKSDWGKHVASVPNIIMVKWLNEEWQRGNSIRYLSAEFYEMMKRKLKDPDYAYLLVDGPSHRMGYGA